MIYNLHGNKYHRSKMMMKTTFITFINGNVTRSWSLFNDDDDDDIWSQGRYNFSSLSRPASHGQQSRQLSLGILIIIIVIIVIVIIVIFKVLYFHFYIHIIYVLLLSWIYFRYLGWEYETGIFWPTGWSDSPQMTASTSSTKRALSTGFYRSVTIPPHKGKGTFLANFQGR